MNRQAKFLSAAGRMLNVLEIFSTFLAGHRITAKEIHTFIYVLSQCSFSTIICTYDHYSVCTRYAARISSSEEGPTRLWAKVPPTENQKVCGFGPLFFGTQPIYFLFSYFCYLVLFYFSAQGGEHGPRGPPLATSLPRISTFFELTKYNWRNFVSA